MSLQVFLGVGLVAGEIFRYNRAKLRLRPRPTLPTTLVGQKRRSVSETLHVATWCTRPRR